MSAAQTLILPISLSVLRIARNDEKRSRALMPPMHDFSVLPSGRETGRHRRPFIAADIRAAGGPFADHTIEAKAGIHLHWTPPDALTLGRPAASGSSLEFPPLPNRWIVTRFAMAHDARDWSAISSRSWIVESDYLVAAEDRAAGRDGLPAPTVPFDSKQAKPTPMQARRYRTIGRASDGATWKETADGERFDDFTAITGGNPAFTSFYPNCSSALGFHDDTADLGADIDWRLTYHVAGWYADGAKAASARQSIEIEHPAFKGANTLFCSGASLSIDWKADGKYLKRSLPNRQSIDFALGRTAAEALSALLARKLGAADLEDMFNSLQFAPPDTPTGQGAEADLEEAIHGAGFAPVDGGSRWDIVPTPVPAAVPAPGKPMKAARRPPLSAAIVAALAALNGRQAGADGMRLSLAGQRRRLFADWYKYLSQLYDPAMAAEAIATLAPATGRLLRGAADTIIRQAHDLAVAEREIADQAAAIRATLAKDPPDKAYQLQCEPAARFWQPQEPVLLVARSGNEPAPPPAPDALPDGGGRRGNRIVDRVQGIFGQAPATGAFTAASVIGRLAGRPELAFAGHEQLAALAREALFLSPMVRPMIAARLGDGARPHFLAGPEGADRLPAGIAAFGPEAARWKPMILEYKARVRPRWNPDGTAQDLTSLFERSADGDMLPPRTAGYDRSARFAGRAFLSDQAVKPLDQLLRQAAARIAGDTRSDAPARQAETAALERIRTGLLPALAPLSQSLNGMGAAMLMHEEGLQLRIEDPYASPPRKADIDAVRQALDGQLPLSPLPRNDFLPVDGGRLEISAIRLIDAFGRALDIAKPRPIRARRLKRNGPPEGAAHLPARLVPPARLNFRFVGQGTGKEADRGPEGLPLIGWVLVSNVDQNIAFYDADGRLALAQGPKVAAGGAMVQSRMEHLADAEPASPIDAFAIGLIADDRIDALRLAIKRGIEFIQPPDAVGDASHAGTFGRPLALVRAELSLELLGGTPVDQSWPALRRRLLGQTVPTEAALERLHFPVQLGKFGDLADGLVGYWVDREGQPDVTEFRQSAVERRRRRAGDEAAPPPLMLTLGRAGARTITLLIDPFGEVHASTGILPVKSIALPPEIFQPSLERLKIAAAAGPVLVRGPVEPHRATPVGIIAPRGLSDGWSWSIAGQPARPIRDVAAIHQPLPGAEGLTLLDGWLVLDPAKARRG